MLAQKRCASPCCVTHPTMPLPLHAAVIINSTDAVWRELQHDPRAAFYPDVLGNFAIHQAAKRASPQILRMLMDATPGAVAASTNMRGDTPLHIAALHANTAAFRMLMEAFPAAVHATNMFGDTPLHAAAASTFPHNGETIAAACDAAPKLALQPNGEGNTPLHLAARSGNISAIRVLTARAPPTCTMANSLGLLPVHVAMAKYTAWQDYWRARDFEVYKEAAMLLIRTTKDAGTEVDIPPTLLSVAARMGHEDMARLVLDIDESTASESDAHKSYPLHQAASAGSIGIVAMLLDVVPHHAFAQNEFLETPLHCAAQSGSRECVAALLHAAPATASSQMADGCTPAFLAAQHNNAGGLELLLEASPHSAEVMDAHGRSPIWVAAWYGHEEVTDLLMKKVPHTAETLGEDGQNALHAAADLGWDAVVDAILKHHPALASVPTDGGETALHLAIKPDFDVNWGTSFKEDIIAIGIVQSLLRVAPSLAMVPTRSFGVDGNLPLHVVASLGMDLCAHELLRVAPQAIYEENANGQTPLECALLGGHVSTALPILQVPGQDAETVLTCLALYGPRDCDELFIHAIRQHVPMPKTCWDLAPLALAGLMGVFPRVVKRGTRVDVANLMAHLAQEDRAFVQAAVSSLSRTCPALPAELIQRIVGATV